MSLHNELVIGYGLFKRGKLIKQYHTKPALLKAIRRIPTRQKKLLKIKTLVQFSLVN